MFLYVCKIGDTLINKSYLILADLIYLSVFVFFLCKNTSFCILFKKLRLFIESLNATYIFCFTSDDQI